MTPKENPTGDLNQKFQITMTETMMIGKEQEAPHIEEETEKDMKEETAVPVMRRGKEEEGEPEATAQITETGGDTIARQGENSAQGP